MNTKLTTLKIKDLENRVRDLEKKVSVAPRSSSRNGLSDLMERQSVRDQKRARDIFSKTHGTITKKRADAMLKQIDQSRNAWK